MKSSAQLLSKPNHDSTEQYSSIFLTNSDANRNWKIGGNEHRRVKMKCGSNYQWSSDPGGQHYVFEALGHIQYMTPMNGNP